MNSFDAGAFFDAIKATLDAAQVVVRAPAPIPEPAPAPVVNVAAPVVNVEVKESLLEWRLRPIRDERTQLIIEIEVKPIRRVVLP